MLRGGPSFGRNHGTLGGRSLSSLSPSVGRPAVRLEATKVEAGSEALGPRFAMNTAGGDIPEWPD